MNFIPKNKKKLNFFFFIFFFVFFFSIIYFSIPKILNFSVESIKKNLKSNNNINIKSISKINYLIFPTPRLSIKNSQFTIGKNVAEINNSGIEIILNVSQILNFKEINYKRLLIRDGTSKINLNKINQLLTSFTKNKKKMTLKKNKIIFLQKDKVLFKITDAQIKINEQKNNHELKISGNFLNNKIFVKHINSPKNKNNLNIKIPGLDIETRVFFEKNNFNNINGFFNLKIFNNFLKFNFIKEDNVKLSDGFIRSRLINSPLQGVISFKPNFFSRLDFEPSNLNMKKLFPLIQNFFFSNNDINLSLIKKMNGTFNFKSKFKGTITNRNGEVLFKNFKVGKNKSLHFSAKIIGFGKTGKIQFSLVKNVKYKKGVSKKIEIIGFLIPSNTKVIFEQLLIDGNKLSTIEVKEYQNKFENNLTKGSLANIFDANKIDRYFKNLF